MVPFLLLRSFAGHRAWHKGRTTKHGRQTDWHCWKDWLRIQGCGHLHYSIYPDDNYDNGIDPHPYLFAVEQNVCNMRKRA